MQLSQIVIRPSENIHILQYVDAAGKSGNMVLTNDNQAGIASLIQSAQTKLPAPQDNPRKEDIEKEIADLETRIAKLKEAIGAA